MGTIRITLFSAGIAFSVFAILSCISKGSSRIVNNLVTPSIGLNHYGR